MEALITTTATGIAGVLSSLIVWLFTTKIPVKSRTVFSIGVAVVLSIIAAVFLWVTGQLDVTSLGTLLLAVIGASQATYAALVKQIQEGATAAPETVTAPEADTSTAA